MVVIDARRVADLDATAAALDSPHLISIAGDVTDASHRAALLDAATRAGSLSLLGNNASRLGPSPLPELADHADGPAHDGTIIGPPRLSFGPDRLRAEPES